MYSLVWLPKIKANWGKQGDAYFLVTEVLDMHIHLLDIYEKMFQ